VWGIYDEDKQVQGLGWEFGIHILLERQDQEVSPIRMERQDSEARGKIVEMSPGMPVLVNSRPVNVCGMLGCEQAGKYAVYVTVYSNQSTRTIRGDLRVCESCAPIVTPGMVLPSWDIIEQVFKTCKLGRPDIHRTALHFQVL
jgi:hypothetical protein